MGLTDTGTDREMWILECLGASLSRESTEMKNRFTFEMAPHNGFAETDRLKHACPTDFEDLVNFSVTTVCAVRPFFREAGSIVLFLVACRHEG